MSNGTRNQYRIQQFWQRSVAALTTDYSRQMLAIRPTATLSIRHYSTTQQQLWRTAAKQRMRDGMADRAFTTICVNVNSARDAFVHQSYYHYFQFLFNRPTEQWLQISVKFDIAIALSDFNFV